MKFGRLTVLERADDYVDHKGHGYARWKCRCDCGNEITVRQDGMVGGHVCSCGCFRKETASKLKQINTTHGASSHSGPERLYGVWVEMRRRCRDESRPEYKNYGGRGIYVCDEWESDYTAFRDWALANGYDKDAPYSVCTLDRIDVNGPYSPENCRWATSKEQNANRRDNVWLVVNGEKKIQEEWCSEYGISPQALRYRLDVMGLPVEEALTRPLRYH